MAKKIVGKPTYELVYRIIHRWLKTVEPGRETHSDLS